jgi:DNA modification methylase
MIHTGDSLTVLQTLPAASVQCCVTSPPYWGLRDYGHDGQIGLEETPEQYVSRLVAVFAEVRRVLADDGVLWLNLGDSYAATTKGGGGTGKGTLNCGLKHNESSTNRQKTGSRKYALSNGLKPKDLVGIPWRVAFALQADGWYLRSDTIWHKPNPMPESVRDRPTKAHEYVFMLSKRARYFWDQEAVREPISETTIKKGGYRADGTSSYPENRTVTAKDWNVANLSGNMKAGRRVTINPLGRNTRSVWTIPTQPYSGAHFAVMPPALADRCIKSGSRVGDTVLDPFSGAGTTGMVARRLRRQYVGIELNPEFADMARQRIDSDAPLLNRMAL